MLSKQEMKRRKEVKRIADEKDAARRANNYRPMSIHRMPLQTGRDGLKQHIQHGNSTTGYFPQRFQNTQNTGQDNERQESYGYPQEYQGLESNMGRFGYQTHKKTNNSSGLASLPKNKFVSNTKSGLYRESSNMDINKVRDFNQANESSTRYFIDLHTLEHIPSSCIGCVRPTHDGEGVVSKIPHNLICVLSRWRIYEFILILYYKK